MACGSVYTKETQQLGRHLTNLDLTSGGDRRTTHTVKQRTALRQDSPSNRTQPQQYSIAHKSGHEAVRFLQGEHERVLGGLHQQIQTLQQKCDDLQFETHLRHVTAKDENEWKVQVADLTRTIEAKDLVIVELQGKLENSQSDVEELTQQTKWRELQLQQQIEAGEQKIGDLKDECALLRAKLRDLRVYSAALRRGEQQPVDSRPESRSSLIADDYDDALSLNSEESYSGSWRDTRLASVPPRRHRSTSGVSIDKPLRLSHTATQSLFRRNSIGLAGSSSPVTARSHSSRPGSVILPPINLSQSVGRPQFRQHMRLSSAPPVESQATLGKRRASEAAVQRRKGTDE